MSNDEKKKKQNISPNHVQKSWGDLMLESWLKAVEDFGPSMSQSEKSKKD